MKSKIFCALALGICLSCSKSSSKGSSGGGTTGSPTTVDANGAIAYAFDPASTTGGTIAINDGSALAGSEIMIPAGMLSIATPISVEEGDSSSPAIASALGVTETPKAASASVIVRTTDKSLIPLQPLSITLPISVTAGLRLTQDKLVVLALYWTASGLKMGVVPSDKVTVVGNKAKFSSANFGQFQLAYLSADPTVLEVASTKSLVSKREASTPESLYVLANQGVADTSVASIGGVFKDGVWTALPVSIAGGRAYPWFIKYHNGKQYVTGSMEDGLDYSDPAHKEMPGVWIDNVWNAYAMPEGKFRCWDLVFAFDSNNRMHTTGDCASRDDMIGGTTALWIDGVLSPLPVGFEESSNAGIAADLKGNILLTAKTGYYVNYKDLVSLKNESGSSPLGNPSVAPNGDIYVGSGFGAMGYWLNGVWNPKETEVYRFAFMPGGELIYTYNNGSKAVLVRAGKETTLTCDISSDFQSTYAYSFTVNRDGIIYVGGSCNGQAGIWKDGVFIKGSDYSDFIDLAIH